METIQAPASSDTLESAVESPKTPKYRAVACRKAQADDHLATPPRIGYATPEAAAARCKELGHDVSDMEEHEDAWLFHQKGLECKSTEGGDIDDIEPGLRGIGCGMGGDSAMEPDKHGYETPPGKKMFTKSDPNATSGEREAIATGNDTTLSRVPFGAQFIKDYCGHHQGGIAMHDEHAGMLENPPIAEANEAWRQEDIARAQEMDGLLAELYPELSAPDAKPAPGVDGLMPMKSIVGKGDWEGAAEDLVSSIPTSMPEVAEDLTGITPEQAAGVATAAKSETPEEELPYGATYLQKVAGHCDAGQAQITDGIKRQEHPRVRDFAEDEMSRLDERKSACKDLMGEHYPDHVAKVFGADMPAETIEDPENQETKIPELDDAEDDDDAEIDSEIAAEVDDEVAAEEEAEVEEEEDEEKKKPKIPKKAAPKNSADLLRGIIKSLADLTSAVAAKRAGAAVVKAAPPPPAKKPPRQHVAEVDPAAVAHLENLKRENDRLQKEVGRLIGTEKRFQIRLASKIGNVKKKKACECHGKCGDCRKQKGTYFGAKDLSAIDESAGGALVKPAKVEEKSDLQDCISRHCSGEKKSASKKNYRIAANVKGRDIVIRPGTPVPYFAKDFRLEDEDGNVFDNRFWNDFKDAEKMLLQLI